MFWAGMVGGIPNGFLHGRISPIDNTITGNNISYIYPDMETSLLGRFKDLMMKDAQESTILGVDCNENGMFYVNNYLRPDPSSPRFYYEPPSNISYGSGPPGVMDPYERKWLELKPANNLKMGEGLYSKKDFERGELVSSYNGFVYGKTNGEYDIYDKECVSNSTKSDDERRHCVKYMIRLNTKNAYMTIPPEHDLLNTFMPSLGGKVYQFISVAILYT